MGAAAFQAFDAWAARYAAEPTVQVETGVALAQARRQSLAELIRRDPQSALERSVPWRVRRQLPPSVVRHLEERVAGRGDFVPVAAHLLPGASLAPVARFVQMGEKRYRTHVYGRRLDQLTTSNIPLHGIALGENLALHESPLRRLEEGETPDPAAPVANPDTRCPVSQIPSQNTAVEVGGETVFLCGHAHVEQYERQLVAAESSLAASAWTLGPKTLLLMRVDFSDAPGEPIAVPAAQTLLGNLSTFMTASSYGRTGLTTTVVPVVLRLPRTRAWYGANDASTWAAKILADARTVSKAAGYDPALYDWDIVYNATIPGFAWHGVAAGGVGGKGAEINGYPIMPLFAHELTHNYGVWHANLWKTGDGSVIGPGSNVEYGHPFDVMGGGNVWAGAEFLSGLNHTNSYYKNFLGWLPGTQVQTAASSGTYRIYALDAALASQQGALKIAKDASKSYWVEFRQNFTGNPWLMNGALLQWGYSSMSSTGAHLLDTTPLSATNTTADPNANTLDAPLTIGRTFADVSAGIHITPIRKGGTTPESLDVVVNLGAFPGNAAPTLTLAASATSVPVGASVSFTASASDPNGDTLAYAWDFGGRTFGPNSATATKSWGVAGTYTVRCTVSDMKGGTAAQTLSISVGSSNQPPVISSAPWANPNPTGTTTSTVNVSASDPDLGPAPLTYTWSKVSGPGGVSFSPNGTTLSDASTATFTAAGSYTLQVAVSDGAAGVTGSLTVVVNQTLTSISVSPATASVAVNGTQLFSATAKDQFGNAMAPQPAFAWTVSGGGALDTSGLFTASAAAGGPFTVTAASGGKSGTAGVTVYAPATGLVGYWKLEELSGVRMDSSGRGNHLADNGGVGSATGKAGNSASLNGSNYLSRSNAAQSGLNVGSALTAAAWINLSATQTASDYWMVLSKYDVAANGRSYRLELDGGKLAAALSPDGTSASAAFLTGVTTLSAGQWYHVAVVFDGSAKKAQLYLNGKPEGSVQGTAFGSLFANSAPLAIGADYTGGTAFQNFKGLLDEARVYNRALSAAEISALLTSPPAPRGDFSGDGKSDLLFRHPATGQVVLWLLK